MIDQVSAEYRGRSTSGMELLGVDPDVQEVLSYDPWMGRFFTPEEVRRSQQVVVLGRDVREAIMPTGDPMVRECRTPATISARSVSIFMRPPRP